MWCCIAVLNVVLHCISKYSDKKVVCSGNWLFKSESLRLYELDAQLQRLYVIGRQGRFNAVDITKWRIALTLKVE
jgi:hypothetical protein